MDKTINLAVCNVCDMIQANKIWVVSPKNSSGLSLKFNEHLQLSILLSEFEVSRYKKDIVDNYNTLLMAGKFSTYTLDERYCAITAFTLKDLKQVNDMRAYCKFTGADYKRCMRLRKKINNHFSRTGIFTVAELEPYFLKAGFEVKDKQKVLEICENIPYTLTRGLAAGIFYEYSNLTQRKTCELFGVSLPCLKRNIKKVR